MKFKAKSLLAGVIAAAVLFAFSPMTLVSGIVTDGADGNTAVSSGQLSGFFDLQSFAKRLGELLERGVNEMPPFPYVFQNGSSITTDEQINFIVNQLIDPDVYATKKEIIDGQIFGSRDCLLLFYNWLRKDIVEGRVQGAYNFARNLGFIDRTDI